MLDFSLLKKLCDYKGVSTQEIQIAEILKTELEKFMNNVEIDKMGNVIAKSGNGDPDVLFTAHMDEIGLIVKNITDDGFIEFEKLN